MAGPGRPGRPGPERPGRRAGPGLPFREPEAPSGSLAVTTLSRAGVWQDGRLAGRVTVVLCHGVLGLRLFWSRARVSNASFGQGPDGSLGSGPGGPWPPLPRLSALGPARLRVARASY